MFLWVGTTGKLSNTQNKIHLFIRFIFFLLSFFNVRCHGTAGSTGSAPGLLLELVCSPLNQDLVSWVRPLPCTQSTVRVPTFCFFTLNCVIKPKGQQKSQQSLLSYSSTQLLLLQTLLYPQDAALWDESLKLLSTIWLWRGIAKVKKCFIVRCAPGSPWTPPCERVTEWECA